MLVTLLTDFGTADYFVAAMKGVILTRAPAARIVDVTHEIPPHDVRAGAFTLRAVYREFPADTVHVCVVDPGVGSDRRPVVVRAGGHSFVGPDNGLFSYVLDREPDARAWRLDQPRFFRHPVSTTFHGRDVFAPVAAALAAGTPPGEVGTEVSDLARLDPLTAAAAGDGVLRGFIVHLDRFGNCVTSIARDQLPPALQEAGFLVEIGGHRIRSIRGSYAEAGAAGQEPFGIWGSAGLLEISLDRDSAARTLGVQRGDAVRLVPASGAP